MRTLFQNIRQLLQTETTPRRFVAGEEMATLNRIEDAYLIIEDDLIADFGPMRNLSADTRVDRVVDLTGRMVMPTFCDSHTHIVFAGSREIEYTDKIRGLSYEEIARRGGGILNSVDRLHEMSEEALYALTMRRLDEIALLGTGAVEIKSGYGLDLENELKMLRVIKRASENHPVTIRATFLGAHAVSRPFRGRQTEYVDSVINEMIPAVSGEDLADFIDVFCDEGFFTVEDTDRILNAGMKYGLRPKIHANEMAYNSGGVQVGVKYNALSVDHLERAGQAEINALKGTETMPTILPGAAFFLNMPAAPAREMIKQGLPVALASDYNPGSSPSGDMRFVLSLGCINLRMLPEEVINATTLNTAYAMGVQEILGSIAVGKLANLIITKRVPNIEYIPYAYTAPFVEKIFLKGKEFAV